MDLTTKIESDRCNNKSRSKREREGDTYGSEEGIDRVRRRRRGGEGRGVFMSHDERSRERKRRLQGYLNVEREGSERWSERGGS